MPAIHIRARNAWDAQEQLNAAEGRLQLRAMRNRTQGILVTKISSGHYVAALSERVPYGFTQEQSANPDRL